MFKSVSKRAARKNAMANFCQYTVVCKCKKSCDLLMQQEQYGTNVPPTTNEEVHIYAYQHNCNNLPTRRREQEDFNNGHKISVQNRVIFLIWGFLLLLVPIVEADKSEDELTKKLDFHNFAVASAWLFNGLCKNVLQ